uniref:Uncharacterized protein n=1 Tax=Glossina austeni TaxID=7395 RepID=A0A1A9V043_GLOAU
MHPSSSVRIKAGEKLRYKKIEVIPQPRYGELNPLHEAIDLYVANTIALEMRIASLISLDDIKSKQISISIKFLVFSVSGITPRQTFARDMRDKFEESFRPRHTRIVKLLQLRVTTTITQFKHSFSSCSSSLAKN